MHLDGLQPLQSGTGIGEAVRGPLGLLDLLEVQLGLPPVIATSADTLMAYQACLAEADAPSRFFHAVVSPSIRSIVGRTLLDCARRCMNSAGRVASLATPDAPARLSDVEALAAIRVPLCRGQRVRRVVTALDELTTQIERVELLDDIDELPPVWRVLMRKLRVAVDPALDPAPRAREGSDLRTLQDTLSQLAAAQDGRWSPGARCAAMVRSWCFAVHRATFTAQAVAEAIIGGMALDEALVIAEHDGIILDNAFERVGLPRAGFQHYSRFAPSHRC
jgi:hypothetical protein